METTQEKLSRLTKYVNELEKLADQTLIEADRDAMALCGSTAFEVLTAAALPSVAKLDLMLEELEEKWEELAALTEEETEIAAENERLQQ